MNAASQRLKRANLELTDVGGALEEAHDAGGLSGYHDRELLEIAAFRLRDAAQRVASLVTLTSSPSIRKELVAVCERLMDEERAFSMRALSGIAPTSRVVARVMRK